MSRRCDLPFSRKWRLKLLFLVIFRIFPNQNCHFRRSIWTTGCDVVRLYVLQRYRSCSFCKRKTRGEFQIELAAPCTLANHNEITSDDTLPFIIFLTPVSCEGSNRLWHQRLLLSPCSLWRHKQTLIGGFRPLAGGKGRTFPWVIERYRFQRYLCFHCVFCVRVFVYCFARREWPYRTKTVFILVALYVRLPIYVPSHIWLKYRRLWRKPKTLKTYSDSRYLIRRYIILLKVNVQLNKQNKLVLVNDTACKTYADHRCNLTWKYL